MLGTPIKTGSPELAPATATEAVLWVGTVVTAVPLKLVENVFSKITFCVGMERYWAKRSNICCGVP